MLLKLTISIFDGVKKILEKRIKYQLPITLLPMLPLLRQILSQMNHTESVVCICKNINFDCVVNSYMWGIKTNGNLRITTT